MRITSTHVENTSLSIRLVISFWDHLHTRGEYSVLVLLAGTLVGSPPHTWRILIYAILSYKILGITSTHVENTSFIYFSSRYHLGSPPHTWRILICEERERFDDGITSTHVENTVNKSQYNNNHKTIDPKISSLCQLLLYLFLSH